jgi:hypothetical protein
MDSKHFEGAVDWVKASLSQKDVAIAITLREMVPFHVKQTDLTITIDFGPTAVKPPEKKIVPLQPAQAPAAEVPAAIRTTAEGAVISLQQKTDQPGTIAAQAGLPPTVWAGIPGLKKDYKGTSMTMDFINADVTNILAHRRGQQPQYRLGS